MNGNKLETTGSWTSGEKSASSTESNPKKRKAGQSTSSDRWEQFGGYMSARRQKMQKQNSELSKEAEKHGITSDIFKNVVIYIDGYTKPSSDELKRLVLLHGGRQEHTMAKRKVTHIIATNLANSKKNNFKGMKIVKPEWITDSVENGKLLSYIPYQLYTAQTENQEGLTSYAVPMENSSTDASSSNNHTDFSASCHYSDSYSLSTNNADELLCLDYEDNSATSEKLANSSSTSSESHKDESPQKHSTSSRHFPKSGDSNFLSEFYTHSRLHHLSTWGAEFRDYVNQLVLDGDNSFPGKDRLKEFIHGSVARKEKLDRRTVMHVDMDCFFVSVGLKKRPDLRGKPIAVTHSRNKGQVKESPNKHENSIESVKSNSKSTELPNGAQKKDLSMGWGSESEEEEDFTKNLRDRTKSVAADVERDESFYSRAEIASCSYEARKAGVKNGMFMGEAKKLCPEIVAIPYDFDEYNKVSRTLYDIVASYTHSIEAVSCDEMLVDCSDLLADTGATPMEFAQLLRQEIFDNTGCTASAGLASNILLAKLATRSAKPNGQYYLPPSDVAAFITKQSIRDLPGVGWALTNKLKSMGVTTCGDLQQLTLSSLQKEFGPKTGQSLFKCARGQDDRPIKVEKERKSVSAEVNYGIRFEKNEEVDKFIEELSVEVHNRLEKIKMRGKGITFKIMVRRQDAPKETSKFMGHGLCNNISKSNTLPMATDDAKIISRECLSIFHRMKLIPSDLRGMGIQVTKLEKLDASHGNGPQSILNFVVPKENLQHSTSGSSSAPASEVKLPAYVAKIDDLIDIGFRPSFIDGGKQLRIHSKVIVSELKRRAASDKIPPPLPTLPDFDSCDDTELTVTTNAPENCDMTDYLLSPSQVDGDVLKELPLEIREQIEAAMKKSKKSSETKSSTSNTRSSQDPGCSHWMKERTATTVCQASVSDTSSIVTSSTTEHQSLQHIDREVLKELPLEIREQIEEEMKAQAQPAVVPIVNRPVEKIIDSPARPPDIFEQFDDVKAQENLNPPDIPSLCGAVSVESVKEMISEWLDSSDPVDDDLEVIKTYFFQLIAYKNLEQLLYILKFLYRKIKKTQNDLWYNVWGPLLSEVQSSVMIEYGYQLKLKLTPLTR